MTGIDFHAHLAPDLGGDVLPGVRQMDGRLEVDGAAQGPDELYRRSALLAYMDAAGLGGALVSPPPPFYRQHLDHRRRTDWVRALNSGLARAIGNELRLRQLAYLPLEDVAAACAEVDRIGDDRRVLGFTGAAGASSLSLADTDLAPLWERLDAQAAVLVLHPGPPPDPRLDEFNLANFVGNGNELALAAAQLLFGGVLTRYPSLTIVLTHCGGAVPSLLGRWEHGYRVRRPGVQELLEPPAVAAQRLRLDCLSHDPTAIDQVVELLGTESIVLGSDWPFAMGSTDPKAQVAHRGTAFTEQVSVGNARQVLAASTRAPEDLSLLLGTGDAAAITPTRTYDDEE